jgi:hypothetical protein
MSHLTPEKRLNKHGVPVTKHVRTDTQSAASGAGIPAPLRNETIRPALVEYLRESMVEYNHGVTNLRPVADIYKSLDDYSDKTLTAYLRTMQDERPGEGFDDMLLSVVNAMTPDKNASELLVIAKLDTSPHINDGSRDRGERFHLVAEQVRLGLYRCYKDIGYKVPNDLMDDSDPEVVRTRGLARLTLNLFSDVSCLGITGDIHGGVAMKLEDPELARYILDHPEDADRLAEVMLERQSTDLDLALQIMNTGTQSLRDGIL